VFYYEATTSGAETRDPPGGWPAGSGGPEQFHSPHGVQPFLWPRLSPPSALPPGPSSTYVWGGDPLGGGRCLLFGPSLTSPLVERLHGRILAPWDIPSPNVSKSRRPFFWSSGVSSWGYPPFVGLLWRATPWRWFQRRPKHVGANFKCFNIEILIF